MSDPTSSEYQQFINAKHERLFNTPHEIIEQAVQKATGSALLSKYRIVKGEANEVYAVTTAPGKEVIVRISHGEEDNFEREKWAITAAKEFGVPAPDVFLVDKANVNGKSIGICIESKLPGVSFKELSEQKLITPDEESSLLVQAGGILSKIHSVKVDGFGIIDSTGKGKHKSVQDVLLDPELPESKLLKAAKKADIDESVVAKAFDKLKAGAATYPIIEPRLLHNDFGPKHLLIDKGRIVGVLDFENAGAGDPVQEFARWQFFYQEEYDMEQLRKGYAGKSIFGPDFEQRLNLWRIYWGIQSLNYYVDEQNQSGMRLTKDRLTKDVA
jgi:aminoglycoside phosphotransferase (APT) family kinase protein